MDEYEDKPSRLPMRPPLDDRAESPITNRYVATLAVVHGEKWISEDWLRSHPLYKKGNKPCRKTIRK